MGVGVLEKADLLTNLAKDIDFSNFPDFHQLAL
jgi:hypothetical protein